MTDFTAQLGHVMLYFNVKRNIGEAEDMPTATLSSKSQLVLPAEVRRKLGIRPGDRLIVELEGDHIIIRKAPASDVEALTQFRSSRWKGYADTLDAMRREWDR